MTKKQLNAFLSMFIVFAIAVPAASAQDSRRSPHDALPPLMKVLDLDRDGMLSHREMDVAAKVLRKLDINGDGLLTMNEVVRTPPKSNQRLSKYMIKKDKNRDGKLSRSELGDRFAKMFEDSDKNKDGLLTQKEILVAVKKGTTQPVGDVKGE
ncbi:hypothetical protein ACFL2H_10530 [Planctomycetota bacterium]